jgi:hypothetical protein
MFTYLFIVSSTALSVAQLCNVEFIGLLVNNEFGRVWKEAAVA